MKAPETTPAPAAVGALPVVEHRLANGLTVLVLERPGSPVVSVQTWYRVGSREEEKGKTGLAHFLEHLLFKGTDTLRKGDIDLVTLRNGGQNNADTTTDRTRYYFSFASDRWERALEIEADRMRGSAFDEHEFQAERGPVLEELRADHDDPWWRLHEALSASAYQVHPYRNPVIGWAEEVVRVPRQDVLDFYDAWYQPGNCTMVIVGDVDAQHALGRVEELFGGIPSAPQTARFVPQEPRQEGERRFELLLEVNVPRMMAAFHTTRVEDDDDPLLDLVQAILTGGKASVLYDRLVRRDHLATSVGAWNDTRRDPGLFVFVMDVQQGVAPADAEAVLWEEVERLAKEGPDDDQLERARALLLAGRVYRLATVSGTAEALGTMHVLGGDWRLYASHGERLATATRDDVRDAAARYFRRSNRTVGWALPRPEGAPPRPPIPGDDVHELPPAPPDERPEPEILHRTPAGRLGVDLPVRRVELDNGLRVLLLERRELPLLSVRARCESNQLHERRPGAAALAGACLEESAAGRPGAEIAREIEALGGHLGSGATGASLRCLTERSERCLDILADVLLRPDFPDEAVDAKRGELASRLLMEDDDPRFTAATRLREEIYGAHPLGRRDKGSAEALRALARDDLVAHHRDLFVPRNTIVSVVGDMDVGRMEDLVRARFEAWADRPPALRELPDLAVAEAAREVVLEEDRDQVHIFMGHLGIRRHDPDFYALLLGDHVLGSGPGFTDRMSRRLRDELGLAYTVFARIARGSDREPGAFTAYIGTSPATRQQATDGMREEIARFVAGPIEERELDDARRYLLGSFVFGFETMDATAEQILQMERLGLGFDYAAEFVRRIEAVTVDDVQQAVRRHIFPDRLLTVTLARPD